MIQKMFIRHFIYKKWKEVNKTKFLIFSDNFFKLKYFYYKVKSNI